MNDIPANEAKISAEAVAAFGNTPNPRLRQVVQSLVRHLHAFASEVELSEDEWLEGIRFLTDTGQKCDGAVRQEFILLSDVIGLSTLVDVINHRASESATETTVFGPFYIAGMPERGHGENMASTTGQRALVLGRVLGAAGEPIAGAILDVWQTAENGMYSGQDPDQPLTNLRGRYRTDEEGRFAIRTIIPVSYPIPTDGPVGRLLQASDRHPWRPAHLHFMVKADGYRSLVTHLFNHDDPYLESDVVFGVKDSLKVVYQPCQPNHPLAARYDIAGPFSLASYDFVLEREPG